MLKILTTTKNPSNDSTKYSAKYYTLPAFNKATRNSNLATNLATVGLFSAIAACGGSSSGGSTDTNPGGGGATVTAVDFNAFVAAAPVNVTVDIKGTNTPVPSTRYASGDVDTTTLYIREDVNVAGELGSLTASTMGTGPDADKGTPTYAITGPENFTFGSESNTITDYFSIESDGTLKLTGEPLDFGTTDFDAEDDKHFTITIQASYGENNEHTDSHTIKVQLGDYYAPTAGGSFTLGNGDDLFQGGSPAGAYAIHGGAGDDIIYGNANGDTLRGEDGDDAIYGGAGIDRLYGGEGNDVVYGGAAIDTIFGNDGDDSLYGEAAADTIYGGDGNDILYGGADGDRFVVYGAATGDFSNNGSDTIKDFTSGDKIAISGGNIKFSGSGNERYLKFNNNGLHVVITGYGDSNSQLTVEGWGGTANSTKILAASDFEGLAASTGLVADNFADIA